MKKIYYQLSSVCQQKTPFNKGRYVFSWGGGGLGNFDIFSKRKCWPSSDYFLPISYALSTLRDYMARMSFKNKYYLTGKNTGS